MMKRMVNTGRGALWWVVVLGLLGAGAFLLRSPSNEAGEVVVGPRASVTPTVTPTLTVTPFVSPTISPTMTSMPTPLANEVVPTLATTRLTRTPHPEIPPTRTPVVPHAWGALLLVGQSPVLEAAALSLAVEDGVVFVGVEDGLVALDGSDVSRPEPIGRFILPIISSEGVLDIFVAGAYAYVVDGRGVFVVDVSNPAGMTLVGEVAVEPDQRVTDILGLDGETLFVKRVMCGANCSRQTSVSALYGIDVQDKTSPVWLGGLPVGVGEFVAVLGLDVVYVGDDEGVVWVVDVADWLSLVVLGEWMLPAGMPITSLAYQDHTLHLLSANQLWQLDMTDPANPTPLPTSPLSVLPGIPAVYDTLVLDGTNALLLEHQLSSLRLLDVSDWVNQQDLGAYGPAYGFASSMGTTFAVKDGDFIWAIDGSNAINVLQLTVGE